MSSQVDSLNLSIHLNVLGTVKRKIDQYKSNTEHGCFSVIFLLMKMPKQDK